MGRTNVFCVMAYYWKSREGFAISIWHEIILVSKQTIRLSQPYYSAKNLLLRSIDNTKDNAETNLVTSASCICLSYVFKADKHFPSKYIDIN